MITPHTYSNISEWLQNVVDNNKIPFAKINISQNNSMLFSEFKHKNLGEYANNHLYRIQSLTKPITSLVSLIVLNKYKININDPIKSVVEGFSNSKVLSNGIFEDAKSDITFAHLLTHTSGITYGFNKSNQSILRGNTEADEFYRNVGLLRKVQTSSINSSEFLDMISALPLAYHPGSRWNYGLSTDLLGVILEKICNKPLNTIFKDELFNYLNMTDTFFPDLDTKNIIPTYKLTLPSGFKIIQGTDQIKNKTQFQSGGGGLISTPDDYHKFCNFILNPEPDFLSHDIINMMKINQISGDMNYLSDGTNFFDYAFAGPGIGFTFGFSIIVNQSIVDFKSPLDLLSWAGSSNTISWIDQKHNFVFTMFSQLIPFGYHNYKKELMNLIYSDSNFV